MSILLGGIPYLADLEIEEVLKIDQGAVQSPLERLIDLPSGVE